MQKTYLFYDIETTGLNKCFDQIMQFAAIRTDSELNELERYNIFVKLNSDAVPSPQAIITHQISLTKLEQIGISEYEAIKQIHSLLNAPNTTSIGYNTLGFDDEFLRFSFYRNLLPPYTHQYANNCNRMDLYPMTVMYFLFKKEIINWPQINDVPTLKLEHLNSSNNFSVGNAHDAMVDVEVTLALARTLIKEHKMWDYLCGYFTKNIEAERINKLDVVITSENYAHRYALMIDGIFGTQKFYQCAVLDLGWHKHYKNQILWLQLDQEKLSTTTIDSIPETTFVKRKRLGESPLLLPFDQMHNKFLSKERLQLIDNNLLWIKNNPKIFNAIINYHQEYKYPIVPNCDIDAALYQNSFWSDFEIAQATKFHNLNFNDKIAFLEKFSNPNMRKLAVRILGRNFLSLLPKNILADYLSYKNNNEDIVDYRNNKRLTLNMALDEINQIKNNNEICNSENQLNALLDLEKFLQSKIG
jgi:exodeoxyribonuclease I